MLTAASTPKKGSLVVEKATGIPGRVAWVTDTACYIRKLVGPGEALHLSDFTQLYTVVNHASKENVK